MFEAEKVVEKGVAYHKKCFTCSKCNRPQDDKLQVGSRRFREPEARSKCFLMTLTISKSLVAL